MSRAIHIEGVKYLSAVEAGRLFGYTNDYIARLAREHKVSGKQVGRQWFVNPVSLTHFLERSEEERRKRVQELRAKRKLERAIAEKRSVQALPSTAIPVAVEHGARADTKHRIVALLQSGCVVGAGTVLGSLIFLLAHGSTFPDLTHIVRSFDVKRVAYSLYHNDASAIISHTPYADDARRNGSRTGRPSQEHAAGVAVFDESEFSEDDIAAHFSDEVEITKDANGLGGVIRPIFKNIQDEEYRFLLVPIKEPDE